VRPTVKLLFSHPAHFISLGFGAGLAPKAPGTVGSVLAWGLYALLESRFLPSFAAWVLGAAFLVAFFIGAACIARTGAVLGEVDHGAIVWDEFVAVWLVLALIPSGFVWQLAGVALFRVFDILKPWPIYLADRRFKNGLGVMFDDVLAAGYTLLCMLIALKVLA
jgi:phosphatidylglycerophosphatase A